MCNMNRRNRLDIFNIDFEFIVIKWLKSKFIRPNKINCLSESSPTLAKLIRNTANVGQQLYPKLGQMSTV